MAVDDVALAIMALEDPTVREWIRGGDYRAFAEHEFSDHERQLVGVAAGAGDEVGGFDLNATGLGAAIDYVRANRDAMSDDVRARFDAFLGTHTSN
jgi:hypothetical protein